MPTRIGSPPCAAKCSTRRAWRSWATPPSKARCTRSRCAPPLSRPAPASSPTLVGGSAPATRPTMRPWPRGVPIATAPAARVAIDNPTDAEPTGAIPGAPPMPAERKPRPEAGLMPFDGVPAAPGQASALSLRLRLAALTEAFEHVDAAQYGRLASIGAQARHRVEAIRTALANAGVAADRFEAKAETPAMGGPFVPLDPAISHSPLRPRARGATGRRGRGRRSDPGPAPSAVRETVDRRDGSDVALRRPARPLPREARDAHGRRPARGLRHTGPRDPRPAASSAPARTAAMA